MTPEPGADPPADRIAWIAFWLAVGLSVALGLMAEAVALYIGGWALLGAAYGEPGTTALGLLIIPAPAILVGAAAWSGWWLMRRGWRIGILLPLVPVGLALAALWRARGLYS